MTTVPEINEDHFVAHSNLTSGERRGENAILSEILTAVKADIVATELDVVALQSYVTGLRDPKDSVLVATTAALPACTAAGSGVGKTLTANANGALTIDGVSPSVGKRVLVQHQVAAANNGIYVVTAAGAVGAPWVLTRATDADSSSEVTPGMTVPVESGTVNALKMFTLVTSGTIVLETTALSFAALAGNVAMRTVWVDSAAIAAVANGSYTRPFATIQAAIDYCETLTITPWDGWTILVMPGSYTESLVITKSDINLIGVGSVSPYVVGAASGYPGLTITNATKASLTTFRGSGTYSDLVNDGAGPQNNIVANMYFQGGGGGANAIDYLGVKGDATADTTTFGAGVFALQEVWMVGTFRVKNVTSMQMVRGRVSSTITLREVGTFYSIATQMAGQFNAEYDGADADGWTASGFVECASDYHSIGGKVTIGTGLTWKPKRVTCNGELEVNDTGAITGRWLDVAGELDINGGSGDVTVHNIYVGGVMGMAVGKTATLNNIHIVGNITLDNGAGAVVFNGGQYMGSLTDVGGRLTFNRGTIGV